MLTDEEKKSDYLETLAEELRMNGFPVEIDNNEIVMPAIFGEYRYHLPLDIARCNRDDCPLHLECARWMDRLPMEEYWFSQFEPKGCENFIEKKKIESKKKKK